MRYLRRKFGESRARRLVAVGLAVLAGVALLSGPVPAWAATTQTITHPGSTCVDVSGGNSANGTPVQLWTCNGTAAQQWTTDFDGTVRALGKCLDVSGGNTANGTLVQLWDCNGGSAQTWSRNGSAFVNPASGRCLDATGGGTAAGTRLQIWDCNGTAAQQWTLPAGSDLMTDRGYETATYFNPDDPPAAVGDDGECEQTHTGPVIVGGRVVGAGHAFCNGVASPFILLTQLVELFLNGTPVGNFGHAQGIADVRAQADATCVAGLWLVYVQTLIDAPPNVALFGVPDLHEYLLRPDPATLVNTWISPEDCLGSGNELLNMSDADARAKIASVGGRVGTVTRQASDLPVDSVISSSLEADALTVDLVESNGNATVPAVLGWEEVDAVNAIQNTGLVATVSHVDDCVSPGDVETQNPLGGVRVLRGSTVTIKVSTCSTIGGGGGDTGSGGGGSGGGGSGSGISTP